MFSTGTEALAGSCAETSEQIGGASGDVASPAQAREASSIRQAEPAAGSSPGAGSRGSSLLARNLGALAGAQAVTWTATLLWTLIVPRALGPVGFGIIVAAQSVSGVLGIVLGFGTRNYLVREMVIAPKKGPRLVGTAIVLRLILAPVVALAAVVWARVAHDGHEATIALYLITAMTILTLLAEPVQAAFQAVERMKYIAYTNVLTKAAQCVIGIALVMVGFRVLAIAGSMAVVAVAALLLNLVWIRSFLHIDVKTNARRMASMAKQSLAFWTFGLFGYFYLWIDTIMLSVMTRSEVVGWYGATTNLFQTLMFLPVLVSTAWLPRLVTAFTKSRNDLLETARTPVELILVISVPMAAGTAMVASPLIHAVYGPGFARAVPVMVILGFCIPPIYMNIMLSQVLLAEKRQVVWTVVMAGAAVVNPLLNLVLIPLTQTRYGDGAIGAAVALVLTELLMDMVGVIIVGRRVFDRKTIRRFVLAVAASAAMWAAFYAARPIGAPIALCAGVATLTALVVALRIPTSDEIAFIRSGLARLRGRPAST